MSGDNGLCFRATRCLESDTHALLPFIIRERIQRLSFYNLPPNFYKYFDFGPFFFFIFLFYLLNAIKPMYKALL